MLQQTKGPKEKVRSLIMKMARTGIKYGAKLDIDGKHTRTIIIALQKFLETAEEESVRAILTDMVMADWPAETYNEVLGQELAQRVLASAGAHQEEEAQAAAVLDSDSTTSGTGSQDITAMVTCYTPSVSMRCLYR